MNYQRKVLDNGLKTITIPMPSFESATVLVMVGAGSRYETRQNNGISHFLEHMAFKGTEKRPSALDIAELIDGIGGEFNAFTGKETTGYYVKSGNKYVGLCLDILSDMLQHSKLEQAEIDKERGVIIEEINLYEDTPARKIGDIYERLLYGDTPMGWDIAGEKEVIQKINREDFVKYMGSLYSPSNMTVVVAGGVEAPKVEEMVEKYFGEMKSFDTVGYKEVVDKQDKPEVMVRQKQTEQVHFSIGFRTVSLFNPNKYALAVLASILGGGMSSRLFHEIRERRGLAYYVRTTSDQYVDAGNLATVAGVDPKRVDDAIQVVVEEYKKFSEGKGNVTEKELSKAKEFIKGHLVLELEDSRSVAGFYAQQEILEKSLENPDELMKKIDEVKVEDVERVAKEFFKLNTLNLALIGNFDDRQRFQNLLKF